MFTDAHAAFFSPRSSPGVAWVVVLLVAPVLATGWLWLAWDSPIAWLCWICVGAILRYWHGGHIRWTRLARLLFAVILFFPVAGWVLWAAFHPIPAADPYLLLLLWGLGPLFLLWFLATWDAADDSLTEAPIAGFLLAALLSTLWDGAVFLIVFLAASLCYPVTRPLVRHLTSAKGQTTRLTDRLGCLWIIIAGVAIVITPIMPLALLCLMLPLVLAPASAAAAARKGKRESSSLTSTALVVFSAPTYFLASGELDFFASGDFHDIPWSMEAIPLITALDAVVACLFALGLWWLPGVLGAGASRRVRRMLQTCACDRDFHRPTLAPGLPWLVRWTGRQLYEEVPRQHDDLADYLVCRQCGGHDIIIARRLLGIIGALPSTPDTDDERCLPLYDPAAGRAISADIDRLDLYPPPPGTALDWDHAIDAVVNALTEDHDRTHPLKRIPVRIHPGLKLPANARRVLAAHFGPVEALC